MEEVDFEKYWGLCYALNIVEQQLLSRVLEYDIPLLDDLVGRMNDGSGEPQRNAKNVLTALEEHPDVWTRVDLILECSQNQQTKNFAIHIFEDVLYTRYKVLSRRRFYLSRNYCKGIKEYIVALIINTYSDPSLDERAHYREILIGLLIQILTKQDPRRNRLPSIRNIITKSQINESFDQDTMVKLTLLSGELFMPFQQDRSALNSMRKEFLQIVQMCQFVLDNSQNESLVNATLNTLLLLLYWLDFCYIFKADLIPKLVYKFLGLEMFRNITLRCLTEIVHALAREHRFFTEDKHYFEEEPIKLFSLTMTQLKQMWPTTIKLISAFANISNNERTFILRIAQFLGEFFLLRHLYRTEMIPEMTPDLLALFSDGLEYLALISEVEDRITFETCLPYWSHMVAILHDPYLGKNFIEFLRNYAIPSFSKIRLLMISRMAQPDKVLVLVKNEQGEIVGEFIQNSHSRRLYRDMRETLVNLTHLDYMDTKRIMMEKLHNLVSDTEWSRENLNTLCWAVGSISGVMHEKDEKIFLFTVFNKGLLELQWNRTDNDRRIIASNIMFIGAQYPRCLSSNWKYLKKFTNWVFDFMHDAHDGIKVMACDTFLKLAQECPRQFLQKQAGEDKPFIEEIINFISTKTGDLQSEQKHTFYEAVGYIVGAVTGISVQENLIEKVRRNPNQGHREMKKTFYSTVLRLMDKRRRMHMRTHINMHWYMPWPMKRHFIDYIENDPRKEIPTKFTAKRKPFRRPVEL